MIFLWLSEGVIRHYSALNKRHTMHYDVIIIMLSVFHHLCSAFVWLHRHGTHQVTVSRRINHPLAALCWLAKGLTLSGLNYLTKGLRLHLLVGRLKSMSSITLKPLDSPKLHCPIFSTRHRAIKCQDGAWQGPKVPTRRNTRVSAVQSLHHSYGKTWSQRSQVPKNMQLNFLHKD